MKFLHSLWPSILKQEIRQLKNKNDLNTRAVAHLEDRTETCAALYLAFLLFFLVMKEFYISLFIIILLPISIWFDFRLMYTRWIAAYLYGEKIKGIVTSATISLYGTQRIKVRTEDNKVCKLFLGGSPVFSKTEFPKIGDEIIIWQDPEKRFYAMPDTALFKEKYCLDIKKL